MNGSNALLDAWEAGEPTLGFWGTLNSNFASEIAASEGPDYVCCDLQHGTLDYQLMLSMFQAIAAGGSTPICRVLSNDGPAIGKVLDAGAAGVIVPLVNNADEARAAVAACRYPPHGIRSYGPIRAQMTAGGSTAEELSRVACILMIETAEGLANVDEIAAVVGVDALYVGPTDLSLSLGLAPAFDRAEQSYQDALAAVLAACDRANVVPGIQCIDGDMAARHLALGFKFVTVASDGGSLRLALRRELAAARSQVLPRANDVDGERNQY